MVLVRLLMFYAPPASLWPSTPTPPLPTEDVNLKNRLLGTIFSGGLIHVRRPRVAFVLAVMMDHVAWFNGGACRSVFNTSWTIMEEQDGSGFDGTRRRRVSGSGLFMGLQMHLCLFCPFCRSGSFFFFCSLLNSMTGNCSDSTLNCILRWR